MASANHREQTPLENRSITATNAKSPLLSLPPELRVRIFEYVFGDARHHVKATRKSRNWRVSLYSCEADRDNTSRRYRRDTQEERDARPPFQGNYMSFHHDEDETQRHMSCYYLSREMRKHKRTVKSAHGRRLPTCLLMACKQVHQDAAAIMWLNHTFEVEFFSDDLESFVSRMSTLQRKAVRMIAFNFEFYKRDNNLSTRPSTSFEDLIISQGSMRASYVALTGLRRVELFVDIWPGIITKKAKHVEQPEEWFNLPRQEKELDAMVQRIRLLERQDLDDVDVAIEEGALMQPENDGPIPVSYQQRSVWEEQVRVLIQGGESEIIS